MKIKRLIVFVILLCLGEMLCYAQDEKGKPSKGKQINAGVDISHDLERRLARWSKNDLLLILICPQIISPDNDPLAFPNKEKKLSVLGFGQLDKDEANNLVSFINKKNLRVPRLAGGYYANLYFLYASSQFSSLDKLTCYISNGFVDVKLDDGKGGAVWVGLPEKCSKLIGRNFVYKSNLESESNAPTDSELLESIPK